MNTIWFVYSQTPGRGETIIAAYSESLYINAWDLALLCKAKSISRGNKSRVVAHTERMFIEHQEPTVIS